MRVLLAVTAAILASVAIGQPGAARAQAAAPLRVMPLGASLTEGYYGAGATYRYYLWNRLVTAGYEVDFVGGRSVRITGDNPYPDFDPDHEGHSGYRTDQSLAEIDAWAAAANPDVVLIHLGTNDITQGRSTAEAAANLGAIVARLRALNPRVAVLLAQIIPCAENFCPPGRVPELNERIADLAADLTTAEAPVVAVDQYSGFDVERDTFDGIHPNTGGDRRIAERWFEAMAALLPTPAGLSLDDSSDGLGRLVYSGEWTRCASCDARGAGLFGGGVTSSEEPGAAVSLTLTLREPGRLKLYLVKAADAGAAAISVDGGEAQTLALYAAADIGYTATWTSQQLEPGRHTLLVRVTGEAGAGGGAAVGLDRVEILGGAPLFAELRLFIPVLGG